jgi:hypothetical protein
VSLNMIKFFLHSLRESMNFIIRNQRFRYILYSTPKFNFGTSFVVSVFTDPDQRLLNMICDYFFEFSYLLPAS